MYDLVFIGGGLSSSLTLVFILEQLGRLIERERTDSRFPCLHFAMIDRNGDFGTGLPYGHLAHPMFLLNETVHTMDICGFSDWLVLNRNRWLEMLQKSTSNAVESWLRTNYSTLSKASEDPAYYRGLHLPRSVFGLFMRETLCTAVDRAERTSKVEIDQMTAESVSLTRVPDGTLRIGLERAGDVACRRVLLGLGSLPSRPAPHLDDIPGYIHNLYGQGLSALLECGKLLSGRASPRRCIIIGSNAAAMEAIYSIHANRKFSDSLDEILVVSPGASFPDGKPSQRQPPFEAIQTQQLVLNRKRFTADDLFAALLEDAQEARRSGYTSLDFSGASDGHFRAAFNQLSTDERHRFVESFGEGFTALNRHTPPEYASTAELLKNSGKLHLKSGQVTAIERCGDDLLVIVDRRDGEQVAIKAAVVINCRGSETLSMTSDPFLYNIIKRTEIARINEAGSGIKVSANFEASPNIFVMGPLLSGHSSETDHIWNLESAPRIHALAQRLARVIVTQMLREISPPQTAGEANT
jgi:uncharacterized NAD(P)/FAD-binding protein YdhS